MQTIGKLVTCVVYQAKTSKLIAKGVTLMSKLMKILITISLLILAINSFFVVGYLKNMAELIGALINSTN